MDQVQKAVRAASFVKMEMNTPGANMLTAHNPVE